MIQAPAFYAFTVQQIPKLVEVIPESERQGNISFIHDHKY